MIMIFDFEPHMRNISGQTVGSTSYKCFYNCSCVCCRQGCCIVECYSYCCCSSTQNLLCCTCYTSVQLRKARSKVTIGIPKILLAMIISIGRRWVAALSTILASYFLLQPRICQLSGANVSQLYASCKSSVIPLTSSPTTSGNNELKLRVSNIYGHSSYEVTNDQQLKTNTLCKMFCNNRKRQRRRRRRRRHRHSHNNDSTQLCNNNRSHSQYVDQETQNNQRSLLTLSNKYFSKTDASCFVLPKKCDILKAIIASWTSSSSSSLTRPYFKAKRNRTNLVWLFIGLFWLEVKLINCNSFTSNDVYIANLINQKGCTICQLEMKNIYNNKDNSHTDYNNNKYNSKNYFYKIQSHRNHNTINNYKKNNYNIVLSDRVRLESIKRQILNKLGLTHKPNVSHPLPKQFIWETIYRADGGKMIGHETAFEVNSLDIISDKRSTLQSETDNNKFNDTRYSKLMLTINSSNNYGSGRNEIFENKKNHSESENKNINIAKLKNYASLEFEKRIAMKKDRISIAKEHGQSDGHHETNKSKPNLHSKLTYRVDINQISHDNSNKDGRFEPYVYVKEYNSQIASKDKVKHGKKNYTLRQDIIFGKEVIKESTYMAEDNIGLGREDFDNTQEIITFAEEGTFYHHYSIVEFAPQKHRIPNQKLLIKTAHMHIRIEKDKMDWNSNPKFNLRLHHLIKSKQKAKKFPENFSRQKIKIWVFRITEGINVTDKKAMEQAFIFKASFDVDTARLGWQKFDLTDTIREWYSDTHRNNLRLLIDCTGCGNQYSLHIFQWSGKIQTPKTTHINPNRPFLVLHTESSKPRRVRRRALDCGGAINGQCCKESFYVSFKALGWDDWIIAPRGYFANYCRGDCSGPFRTPDTFQTFHTHFIEEYRKMGLLNGMKPCCAPVKFSSMSLIYYGDDGIIKRDLPKMVVDECGCP